MWIAVFFSTKQSFIRPLLDLVYDVLASMWLVHHTKDHYLLRLNKGLLLSGPLLSYSENKIYLETVWKFLKKIIRATLWSSSSPLGTYPKALQSVFPYEWKH